VRTGRRPASGAASAAEGFAVLEMELRAAARQYLDLVRR